jgi:hypothetical protein
MSNAMTQDCERITVTLVPKAAAGLACLQERTRLSKTDLVNRAISLYELIDGQTAAGSAVLIRKPDGTDQQVMFL